MTVDDVDQCPAGRMHRYGEKKQVARYGDHRVVRIVATTKKKIFSLQAN